MVEKLDSLGRRKRTTPQATGKRITLQDRDWLWLQKLQEHGPLPSSFLLEYCKDTHSSEKKAQERLTDLFNENNNVDGGNYLSRPPKQFATIDSRYNQLVYDLTKASRKALAREYPASNPGNVNAGPWVHKFMVACITASIDLICGQRNDLNYIPASTILARAEAELRYPVSIKEPASGQKITKDLIPDALFGLEYVGDGGSKYRFFVVEADRSTEPATSKNFNRKSLVRNLLQYRAYVEGGSYKEHLNLTAPLLVLNVANSEKRLEQMMRTTESMFPDGSSYLLFQDWDDFGEVFRPPEPNSGLIGSDWGRVGVSDMRLTVI